jgi:hypothetical protein
MHSVQRTNFSTIDFAFSTSYTSTVGFADQTTRVDPNNPAFFSAHN